MTAGAVRATSASAAATAPGNKTASRGAGPVAPTPPNARARRCSARLSEEKAFAVLGHLNEGRGVRQTGRLLNVHRDTVMRYGRLAGQHAHDANWTRPVI